MDTGIVNKSPSVYVYIVVSYNFFVSVRQLYIYQVDFDEIIKKNPEEMEIKNTSNSTSFMKSMIIKKGCAITIEYYRKRLFNMLYNWSLGI